MSLLAFSSLGVLPRSAIARALEMHVSLPAGAAFTKNKLLLLAGKIDNRIGGCCAAFLIRWPNDGSHRHLHDLVRRGASIHFLSHSVAAAFRFNERLVEKIREIVGMTIGAKNDIAAAAAVAAI